MKKKITVEEFVEELRENFLYFKQDMIDKNFSVRNENEWFKLLSDYLCIDTVQRIELENSSNRFDNYDFACDDDQT